MHIFCGCYNFVHLWQKWFRKKSLDVPGVVTAGGVPAAKKKEFIKKISQIKHMQMKLTKPTKANMINLSKNKHKKNLGTKSEGHVLAFAATSKEIYVEHTCKGAPTTATTSKLVHAEFQTSHIFWHRNYVRHSQNSSKMPTEP